MARAATPTGYRPLAVVTQEPPSIDEPEAAADAIEPHLLTDVAHHFMVYIHPEAYKALCRYALEQTGHRAKVKPHDLMIEALEAWFAAHGLTAPVRAKPRIKVKDLKRAGQGGR